MKKNNKAMHLFVLIMFFLFFSPIFNNSFRLNIQKKIFLSENDVSNYQILNGVKYDVAINYTVTRTSVSNQEYYYKIPRLNNRTPYSNLTSYTPPYQESELLFNKITGSNDDPHYLVDRFNNTYDLFNATLSKGDSLTFSQNYIVRLNEISFQNVDYDDIGEYNYSDIIFDLYCNRSVQYYNTSDEDLIYAYENEIGILKSDNPIEIAKKICDWIAQNIQYEIQVPERGASWAYKEKKGDCSEYADLLITLLRIGNIPARKVTGFVLSNQIPFKPNIGDVYTFYFNDSGDNLLGHAWVEYFVPNIGWIACDPTWYSAGGDYFNKIDYQRLGFNIGQWFYYPPSDNVSEYINPPIGYPTTTDYSYILKITVLETFYAQDYLPYIILGISLAVIAIGVGYYVIRRRKKTREIVY
ncbi:MAG: Protein-glutamine gamma-glutamyltransferase [Promethearchaeota archaeon]|nr:MAG: Protein-glutamine gamma-glutamyltransferase [Candidatus Lokiarchaeota archaeon]